MTIASDLELYTVALTDPVELFRRATGFEPQPWQPGYLRETRHTVTLKGRQVGASTATGLVGVRLAILRPRSTSLIISPSLNQSKEVLERAGGHLEKLGIRLIGDSASSVELENHSRIISLPGSRKSVRGWTATALLVIDEAAFLDPETFLAARAIGATAERTGARVVVQSTPAGPFGHFHKMWEHPESGWAKFHVTSEQVDTIGADFLATERGQLTDEEYAQEYLGEFKSPGMGLVDPARLAELTETPTEDLGHENIWARAKR